MHICYDCNFPECARGYGAYGSGYTGAARLNWPEGRQRIAEHVVLCRAYEKQGEFRCRKTVSETERNARFIGLSRIIDTRGDIVARGKTTTANKSCTGMPAFPKPVKNR